MKIITVRCSGAEHHNINNRVGAIMCAFVANAMYLSKSLIGGKQKNYYWSQFLSYRNDLKNVKTNY